MHGKWPDYIWARTACKCSCSLKRAFILTIATHVLCACFLSASIYLFVSLFFFLFFFVSSIYFQVVIFDFNSLKFGVLFAASFLSVLFIVDLLVSFEFSWTKHLEYGFSCSQKKSRGCTGCDVWIWYVYWCGHDHGHQWNTVQTVAKHFGRSSIQSNDRLCCEIFTQIVYIEYTAGKRHMLIRQNHEYLYFWLFVEFIFSSFAL